MSVEDFLERSNGTLSPSLFERKYTTRLLYALQPAPQIRFNAAPLPPDAEQKDIVHAHRTGVNAITIDRFEGRYLISGGADSSISLWDLEATSIGAENNYTPLQSVNKGVSAHKFGITHLSFYAFDSLAFLSSSYDCNLKLYSSETLQASASFDLDAVVYSHALSQISSHLLVACATQHPMVRLVDLRSGASTHSLVGHSGAVLSVNWSPQDEHVLATCGVDGTARLWDVRRSAGVLGVFDMDDSIGIVGYDKLGTGARRRERGRAHTGPVNGVVWTEDGQHVVTCGHDEQVRVWNVATGANTLANFGPTIKNSNLTTVLPVIAPRNLVSHGRDVMFFPNEREILMFELFEGKLIKRLRAQGVPINQNVGRNSQLNNRKRITAIAWRYNSVELYSSHSDGVIRSWRPRTKEDAQLDDEKEMSDSNVDESRKRKRQVLEDIYRDLTAQKITYT